MSFLTGSLLRAVKDNAIKQLSNAVRSITINPPRENLPKAASATEPAEEVQRKEVFDNVNKTLQANAEGRLFAVLHLCGKQFKVTAGDLILVEGYWPPTIGDKIRLEKVLLVGGKSFTLIGTPLIKPGLVDVQATIIEKTLTHTKTNFKKKRRKQYMRINFYRSPNTMIRINSIDIVGKVDETGSQEPQSVRIF